MDTPDDSHVLRPKPRRPSNFSLAPISTNTSTPDPSPNSSQFDRLSSELNELRASNNDSLLGTEAGSDDTKATDESAEPESAPSKTGSILNLTSSTLFGIYSPTGYDANRDEPLTPWGTGAQTPLKPASVDQRNVPNKYPSDTTTKEDYSAGVQSRQERGPIVRQDSGYIGKCSVGARRSALLGRTILLFVLGVAYGEVIAHLHDARNMAPVRVDRINRSSWQYLGFWGMAGVALGGLLPWVDTFRQHSSSPSRQDVGTTSDADVTHDSKVQATQSDAFSPSPNSLGADWNPIVRSIGAFVGIAFAIRKLPWQSTLQVSLTLALVNPMIWYLIDRTRAGFILAMSCGTIGAAALISINPEWIPSPAMASTQPRHPFMADVLGTLHDSTTGRKAEVARGRLLGLVSYESIGVATWISSVLFCSCIFFGNVGRRLTLKPR